MSTTLLKLIGTFWRSLLVGAACTLALMNGGIWLAQQIRHSRKFRRNGFSTQSLVKGNTIL